MSRILVTGGRNFDDFTFMVKILSFLRPTVIIHGDYTGADALAKSYAMAYGLQEKPYPANWKRGKRAGPERNQRMIDESAPDIVVAFPGGAGTADCVKRARKAGIVVMEVEP